MAGEHYREFIEEAFIQAMRSVLIVDDDYPTYDEILMPDASEGNPESPHARKAWRSQRERVANLIASFRRMRPPLLVDIHDGSNVTAEAEVTAASHLHQCDLLVLDYELDRDRPGDGTGAIGILRALMANHHFNLVVIYTNEDLDIVFDSVRWGLVAPSADVLSKAENEQAETWIDVGEDDFPNFSRQLSDSLGAAQYFHSRMNPSSYLRTMARTHQPYSLFCAQADRVNWTRDQRRLVLRHLLKEMERAKGVVSDTTDRFTDLQWSSRGPRWIKSNSAFIAFSRKTDNDDDLLSDLRIALNHWCPRPSRLFLTKLRAEIDDFGVAAQASALSNHHALAYWYYGLLASENEEDRRWRISESVSRHAGQLMQAVLPRVEEYASRLIAVETAGGETEAICLDHFGVDLNKEEDERKAILEHNTFVCSMQPAGWHLTTGHVFSIFGNHWLCLSPSCDTVPSQVPKWRTEIIGERLPFIGVKLLPAKQLKALRDIHSNRFVFLRIDNEVRCFCFNDASREGSAPHWQVFFAENRGRFSGSDFRFAISYIKQDRTRLVSERLRAHVVGQLRYEYALNLLQKLGVSLARVGLDFSNGMGPEA